MKRMRSHAVTDSLFGAPSARRRRALLAIPVLGTLVLAVVSWTDDLYRL